MMKNIFVLLLLLLLTLPALAQGPDTVRRYNGPDREEGLVYQKKSRKQRTAGWVVLGVGAGALVVGGSTWDLFATTGSDAAIALGMIAMLSSIPVFISSAKNKGRAEILLRNVQVPVTGKHHLSIPSAGIAIPLHH